MYAVPYQYKSILSEGNLLVTWYGTITLTDNTAISFSAANIADGSGQITQKCSESSEIGIGNAYSSEFSAQFKNLPVDRHKLFDGIIELYAKISGSQGINTWEDAGGYAWEDLSTYEWGELSSVHYDLVFPMGQYIIKEAMRTANDVKVTAYDFMILSDIELPSQISQDEKIPYEWIELACTSCGITLGLTLRDAMKLPNGVRKLAFSNASTETKTWRDIIAQAAEVMGGNAMIGRDGKLTVRRYSSLPLDSITPGFRYTSDFSDYVSYYTGIYLSYRDGGVQDYQRNTTEQLDTGLTYDLGYNSFLQISDDTARHKAMKEIIDAHAGLNFVPFKASMPFNPAYDLMDTVRFYGNQASVIDVAPITAITFKIGGKMDISCGGEDPTLQEARSKAAKAIESISSGSGYNDDFWMVIGHGPEQTSVTIPADTPTKIVEVLFYAKEALSMLEVNCTATYSLLKTSLIEAEVFVDEMSVYKTQENQWPNENRLAITTGYQVSGSGSHKVEIYLTVKESSLDIGTGGVLMDLSVTENNEYLAQDYGVYGIRKATVLVEGGGNGYYGGAQDVSSQVARVSVGSAYSDLGDQDYGSETGYSLPPTYDVSQGFIEYINPNRSELNFYLANWPYRMTDKFELVYKMISNPAQMGNWPTIIGTSAASNAKLYAQFNFWAGRTVMNLAYNGLWAGDGNMSYTSPFDYENYYRLVGDAGTFTLYKGPTLDSITTQCFQKVFADSSGSSGLCVTLLPPGNYEKLDMNIYGLKVWDANDNLLHHYRPIPDGLCDVVCSYAFMATTTGHINGPAVN